MNARQTKKFLKKQINKLQSDNDLMHRIIADSPKMQKLYDDCTKSLNVQYTTMQFQELKAKRMIPEYMRDVYGVVDFAKQAVAKDLFEGIKDNITYEVDDKYNATTITASIYVGRKRGIRMKKCNVCGRRFRLIAKNRYEVVKSPVGLNCLTQGTVYFNAFDCPHCGCQNIVGIIEKEKVRDAEEQPQAEIEEV